MSTNLPIVSVCCLVYNHEPFLRECFEGFVMQKTTFPIEILVHDDASTDHSVDIIREYTEKYPDLFKPIYQNENQYSKGKGFVGLTLNLKRAKGKYIAMCEGDDYWTDPLKLQKQVDILEKNPTYYGCFHNANVVNSEGVFVQIFHSNPKGMKSLYDFTDCVKGWFMPTASILYRKTKLIYMMFDYVSSKYNIISGDRLLIASIASNGYFYYIPEKMSIYRKHIGGISSWGNHIKIFKSNICLFVGLRDYLAPKYNKVLTNQIFRWHGILALEYYKQSCYVKYLEELFITLMYVRCFVDLKTLVKNYLLRK